MKITQLESFHGGDILKIYSSDSNFYYFDAIAKVELTLTPEQVNNLVADELSINCAALC